MKVNEKEWYIFLEGEYEGKGAFANFYCKTEGIGEAIDLIKPLAKKEGIYNLKFIETTRIDNLEGFEYPDKIIDLSQQVKMTQALSLYEKKENEYSFTPPNGIIFDTVEGEYDIEKIEECFVAYDKNDLGIFELELVIDENNLEHVFYLTTKFLPEINGFWIWICNHWEDKTRQLFVNKEFTVLDSILGFLKSNTENTIDNGFIDIVIHSIQGETNLTLNEHKKISLHTKSEEIFNDFIGKVIDLGYEQTKDMYNIEFGYHHWHYISGKGYRREDFCNFLLENNFEEMNNTI